MRRPGKTVLLVEDEVPIRNLLSGVLAREYRVLQAADGESALRVATDGAGKLDLLLTDVQMPGMSGFELADRLRENHPNLKIVFISGFFSTDEFQRRVLNYKAYFLSKPFSIHMLLGIVHRLLRSSDGSAAAPVPAEP